MFGNGTQGVDESEQSMYECRVETNVLGPLRAQYADDEAGLKEREANLFEQLEELDRDWGEPAQGG